MATDISEDHKSRRIKVALDSILGVVSVSEDRSFTMKNYSDEDSAISALLADQPATKTVQGLHLVRTGCEMQPELADAERTLYRAKMTWVSSKLAGGNPDGSEDEPEVDPGQVNDQSKRSFDFSSRETVQIYAVGGQISHRIGSGGTAFPNTGYGTGINKDSDDLVPEGVPVNAESCTFSFTKVVSKSIAQGEWFRERLDQDWTLNAAEFFGFPARTVALVGVTGEYLNSGDFLITYKFEYRKNQTDDTNKLTIETRPGHDETLSYSEPVSGWDYIWYRYKTKERVNPTEPGQASKIVRYMSSVHVARTYLTSDFTRLGDL